MTPDRNARIADMQIITKRLLLRDFVEDDAPAFLAYHEDPRAFAFYGPPLRKIADAVLDGVSWLAMY